MEIQQLYELFLNSNGISIDTRTLEKDQIFFALKGDNFDGNLYVEDALKTAKYVVCENDSYINHEQVSCCKSSLETLQRLANYHRRKLGIEVIGITGSNGKTTTKELLTSVLSAENRVFATKGNLNNHIGVPLSLLSIQDEEIAVIEMGANHPGEIALLCTIAEPNAGIITNIGKAHLEGFGSLEGVKKTKGELYDFLEQSGGTAIVNQSDSTLCEMVTQRNMKAFYYGGDSAIVGILENSTPSINGAFSVDGSKYQFTSALFGVYNFNNILTAVATGVYYNLDLEGIPESISAYIPVNNRSQILKGVSNTLILDAYNANPSSMELALSEFYKRKAAKKMVILGDMLELGSDTETEHRKILNGLVKSDVDQIILVGDYFLNLKDKEYDHFHFFCNVNDCIEFLRGFSPKEFLILLKGSRKISLEKTKDVLIGL